MKTLKTLLFALLGFFIIYLTTSFIQWDINPSHWASNDRTFTGFLGVVASLFSFGIYKATENDKSN